MCCCIISVSSGSSCFTSFWTMTAASFNSFLCLSGLSHALLFVANWFGVVKLVVSGPDSNKILKSPLPPATAPFSPHLNQDGRALRILLVLWRKDSHGWRETWWQVKNVWMVNKGMTNGENDLLFTVTVALLVAVPCWLVATALYSAVSLTTHLQDQTACNHRS